MIYIDIETIPGQSDDARAMVASDIDSKKANLTPPGNYKKPESIEQWRRERCAELDESFDKLYRKQALDGGVGEICSIAWAVDDFEIDCLTRTHDVTEKDLLAAWVNKVTEQIGRTCEVWCGHNVSWDLRFIYQRLAVNAVKPGRLPIPSKHTDMFDTMTEWAGRGRENMISLDRLCHIFKIPGKGDMDGSKVYDAWLAGEFNKIREYNIDDVAKVRGIHKMMTFSYE